MISYIVVTLSAITLISIVLMEKPNHESAYAQPQGTNFTQLFATDKEFHRCFEDLTCYPAIDVLYHDPALVVLQSDYIDIIWKGVAVAQREGYRIDAMTSYAVSSALSDSPMRINLLIAMSK
jgi:hypothetical protein